MTLVNMKIGNRLAMSFGLLTILMLGFAIYAVRTVRQLQEADDSLYKNETSAVGDLMHVTEAVQRLRVNVRDALHATETAQIDGYTATIDKLTTKLEDALQSYASRGLTSEERALYEDMKRQNGVLLDYFQKMLALNRDPKKKAEAFALLYGPARPFALGMQESLDKLSVLALADAKRSSDENQAMAHRATTVLVAAMVACLLLAVLFGVTITRSITVPVAKVVELLEAVAQGDLAVSVPEALVARRDEAGVLARAMQTTVGSLSRTVREVEGGVQQLAASSTELSAVASQTSQGVQTLSAKSASVAAAAEESSASGASVADGMKQASSTLTSVATATEEMSAAIAEVASNAAKARAISEQATEQGRAVSGTMKELGQAAQQIGKVIETITNISSQTNLLALNATIEAARAGAAGKGFAVVANEIKELARQTAAATEDIKTKINGVQVSAGGAIDDIEKITTVVRDVGSLVTAIAASIEEQATVTRDVARDVATTSAVVTDADERVSQVATVSKAIAGDIAGVNSAASELSRGGEQVHSSAAGLSQIAEQLRGMMSHFKL